MTTNIEKICDECNRLPIVRTIIYDCHTDWLHNSMSGLSEYTDSIIREWKNNACYPNPISIKKLCLDNT